MDKKCLFENQTGNRTPVSQRDCSLLDLIISLLPGLKVTEKIMLMQTFDSQEQLFVQSKNDIELIIKRILLNYWDIGEIQEKAGRIDTICRMRSIKWVSWMESDYPPLLRETYDPPPVIYYRGALPNPVKPLLGMVGTRKPSPQAAEQAYKIAGNIGRKGVSVISGLALGIDSMSHRGNLIGGVPGYAVLGCGIDEIYPSVNKPLAKRILDSGGAIISEYPPGVRPGKWTFPARNRIIAALSRSVLIVEAPKKSGALITAAFALEQGKDLWVASSGITEPVLPGGLNNQDYRPSFNREGTIKLANDGAQIIHSALDVFENWNINVSHNKVKASSAAFGENREEMISSLANFLDLDVSAISTTKGCTTFGCIAEASMADELTASSVNKT
ncbi:MAG: DNA-processing protein DprA [Treponema sp.]|nr:DNA-processing protein DprA [Treponema sp.]